AQEPNYDLFCYAGVVQQLFATAARVAAAVPDPATFRRARSLANPYEATGRACFLNRSAVKMANLDALADLVPRLRPMDRDWGAASGGRQIRFVDVCSGPGGFSEYVLWRCRERGVDCRGWGMTLKGEQDFQLDRFHPEVRELARREFTAHYGADNTGEWQHQPTFVPTAERVRLGLDDVRGLVDLAAMRRDEALVDFVQNANVT
ncbi:FtsJ methyltransferase domain-containing protein 2, partial [Cladochytrium tenue]